jgi:hypothetical protein
VVSPARPGFFLWLYAPFPLLIAGMATTTFSIFKALTPSR